MPIELPFVSGSFESEWKATVTIGVVTSYLSANMFMARGAIKPLRFITQRTKPLTFRNTNSMSMWMAIPTPPAYH